MERKGALAVVGRRGLCRKERELGRAVSGSFEEREGGAYRLHRLEVLERVAGWAAWRHEVANRRIRRRESMVL